MKNTLSIIVPEGRYNKSQACRLLGVSRSLLENAINKNLIRIYKHEYEKRVYVIGEDLINYYNAINQIRPPESPKRKLSDKYIKQEQED